MRFLEMTLSGSALIVVIILIRALGMNRLPKKTFLFLWGAALLRLLIPFSISSKISIYTFLNSQPVSGITEPVLPPATTSASTSFGFLTILWLGGVFLCTIFFFTVYFISYRRFKTAAPLSCPFLDKWISDQRLHRRIQICSSHCIASPMTYGVLRPVILLPNETLLHDEEQLRYILTHEGVHIRRFDSLTKILFIAAVCLHWFNPFCWILYILANRDLEISCDEAVLRLLGQEKKSAYARALVSMEEQKFGIAPLANHFSKNALEERIVAILKGHKTSKMSLLASVTLFLLASVVFSTSAFAANPPENLPESPSELLQTQENLPVPEITVPLKLKSNPSQSQKPITTDQPDEPELSIRKKEDSSQTEPADDYWRLIPE